jgi:dTDP-4-dehydrorhamnose reductase
LKIVDSQTGSPTSAPDVAAFIHHVLKNDPKAYGAYHFTNQGAWTWFDFAQAINNKLDLGKKITPVADFKTAAKRPAYSVMDCHRTEEVFGYKIPAVEEGLDGVVAVHQPQ